MSLRVYTVHRPPAATTRRDARDPHDAIGPELVKEGFSWPAFFFGFLWSLTQKMWLVSAALLFVATGLGVAFEAMGVDEITTSIVFFAVAVLVGMFANDWKRASLQRRGYHADGVVTAANLETALRRYLDLQAIGSSMTGGSMRQTAPAAHSWQAPDAGPWGRPQ